MLDIKKGILIITGDVGSAIANWYSPVTAKKLKYVELQHKVSDDSLDDLREDFEVLLDWCNNHQCADAQMSPEIEMICDTYAINLGRIGSRISPRVHLWAVGYQMLAEQLGL